MQAHVQQTSTKKVYTSPKLHVYGSVQSLTKGVGMVVGDWDGMATGQIKTQ